MKWPEREPCILLNRKKKFKIMKIVDLHVHSTKSDGSFTPCELVDYAIEKGLSAFALTDHDTTEGLDEAMAYAADKNIEVIPGIEFSTEYEGQDIHILGLYINYHLPEFKTRIQDFINSRDLRNRKMCTRLQEAGFDITYEKLLAMYPGSVITRSHYAGYLLAHGYIKSRAEAFDRYIGDHSPYYVPREKVTPAQAVQLILQADGIPILAHPLLYHMSSLRLDTLVSQLKNEGLMGLEAIYCTYTAGEERQMRQLAAKYNLLISGGSDFHGTGKPKLDLAVGYGSLRIPASILDDLKQTRCRFLFTDMDGTLLNHDSRISLPMKQAIDHMTAAGHKIILSSGRPLNSILEVARENGLYQPGTLIISNNGAFVYDCDKETALVEHRLSTEEMTYLVNAAYDHGLHCHVYTDTQIVSRAETRELAFYTQKIHLPVVITEDIVTYLTKGTFKIQVICLDDHSRLEAFRQDIAAFCQNRVQTIFSTDYYLELLPLQAGKGNAVSFVCEHFHIPVSHSYGAGDAENDISMLEMTGTSIAMANATDAVKEAADIVTSADNDHDGLLEIIERYFL